MHRDMKTNLCALVLKPCYWRIYSYFSPTYSTLLTQMWRTRSIPQTWDWCKRFRYILVWYGLGVALLITHRWSGCTRAPSVAPTSQDGQDHRLNVEDYWCWPVNLRSSWDFCCDGLPSLPSFWIGSTKGWWQRRCQQIACVPAITNPAGPFFLLRVRKLFCKAMRLFTCLSWPWFPDQTV